MVLLQVEVWVQTIGGPKGSPTRSYAAQPIRGGTSTGDKEGSPNTSNNNSSNFSASSSSASFDAAAAEAMGGPDRGGNAGGFSGNAGFSGDYGGAGSGSPDFMNKGGLAGKKPKKKATRKMKKGGLATSKK